VVVGIRKPVNVDLNETTLFFLPCLLKSVLSFLSRIMLQRPKNQSSNVVITIKYGGLKATQFFSKYTAQAYRQLLEDLRELGFPFPKKSNIVFLSHGTLEFFWPIALHEKVCLSHSIICVLTIVRCVSHRATSRRVLFLGLISPLPACSKMNKSRCAVDYQCTCFKMSSRVVDASPANLAIHLLLPAPASV
jgi:hypothetical protein